jgi:acyl-CoA thioester hydrolase
VLPSADQVDQLPAELKRVVPPEFEDLNGHMNIRHYFDVQIAAVAQLFGRIGYEQRPGSHRARGPFTLDQALHYHHEVLVGAEISSHLRLVGRTDRVLHGMAFLIDRTRNRLANTLEFVLGNVDMEARRLVAYDDGMAACLDQELARGASLDWEVPIFGRLEAGRGSDAVP